MNGNNRHIDWDDLPAVIEMHKRKLDTPINFQNSELGKFLAAKFNHGRPFTIGTAKECDLPFSHDLLREFQEKCGYDRTYAFHFTEFRYFEKAHFELGDLSDRNFCGLREIVLPPTWKEVPAYCFYKFGCLDRVWGENVTSIGDSAFKYCTYLSVFPSLSNVKKIGKNAFGFCRVNLRKIVIDGKTESIGACAFNGCENINEITITAPKLKEVSEWCFHQCPDISKITLGGGVEEVDFGAFHNDWLKDVVILKEGIKFNHLAFDNIQQGLDRITFWFPDRKTRKKYKEPLLKKIGFGDRSVRFKVDRNLNFENGKDNENKDENDEEKE